MIKMLYAIVMAVFGISAVVTLGVFAVVCIDALFAGNWLAEADWMSLSFRVSLVTCLISSVLLMFFDLDDGLAWYIGDRLRARWRNFHSTFQFV